MRKLVREAAPTRSRGRLERASTRDEEESRPRADEDQDERRHLRRGRVPLRDEFNDLNRGAAFMGVESTAIALDVVSRVLRRAVDRAFDEDYDRPGDVIRGITREVDDAGYDLATELRGVPRRLSRKFDESLRSPRADRGERERRAEREGSSADSPAATNGRLRREK